MRINSRDETLKKNYIQKYQFLISEYEQVKAGNHPQFKYVKDFYASHGTCPQTFLKYYGRYKNGGGDVALLLPQKRGAKYRTRRTPQEVEARVLDHRALGMNRYEICLTLKEKDKIHLSPSTVYKVLKRYGQNKKTVPMVEEKRKIIKEKMGELGHVDCYHLSKDTIHHDSRRYYLVGVIDSCTRLAWVEILTDIKALTVMFGTMRCFNQLNMHYGPLFQEVLTDNGPEFGTRSSKNKDNHPFERMLEEMKIKHRYTRPYRPQTNGKIERFWRTLNEDLIEGTHFESFDHFKDELFQYLVYYNTMRPHQALNGKTPQDYAQMLSTK